MSAHGGVRRWRFDNRRSCPDDIAIRARDLYASAIAPVHRAVVEMLEQRGIVVESCPSSNMALGQVGVEDHPLFDLHGRVSCSLSTDDPTIFGANIRDEYVHLGNGATTRGNIDVPALMTDVARVSSTIGAIQQPLSADGAPASLAYASVLADLEQ
jgi:hypothetical protein